MVDAAGAVGAVTKSPNGSEAPDKAGTTGAAPASSAATQPSPNGSEAPDNAGITGATPASSAAIRPSPNMDTDTRAGPISTPAPVTEFPD